MRKSICLVIAPLAAAAFTDSERFERWSHFKDYGVPGTVHDPVNKAAIADGACRLVVQQGGSTFWHSAERTQQVLDTLAKSPKTDKPSYFTLTTKASLERVCKGTSGEPMKRPDYDPSVIIKSFANWHRAICAPATDPTWEGAFDPAYQPQQVALTSGFLCIASCDSARGVDLPAAGLFESLEQDPQAAARAACTAAPWGDIDFGKAKTLDELASLSQPLRDVFCKCSSAPEIHA
eukprot:TRINITY_DN8363_c0_g1_i1.p1 TRINITY_DN8363_c0_g1~~TRINITY_DN8363_c0_g1_i1.p1  ORF type:complete len:235 (+),score=48.64 TRINITY_DN8363_c0_g1_i1:214-918(+)